MSKPLVGISSCLMGNKVRYDGQGKFNRLIDQHIAPYVSLLPICPEAAVGLGIPRPPVQLIEKQQDIFAIGRDNPDINVTEELNHFGDTLSNVHTNLCGYIFQSRSPSCGVGTTPIFNENREQVRLGDGLVVAKLKQHMPWLPIVNDTDLADHQELLDFMEKVNTVFNHQGP